MNPSKERCPTCGAVGKGRIYAYYKRYIVDVLDGKPFTRVLTIPRILCACGHTHAVLHDLIIPYKQYTLPFILHVLKLHFSHSMTIRALCEAFQISPGTLYGWKRAFEKHRSWWLGFACSEKREGLPFLSHILSSPVFSEFTSGFWKKTLYSFLQTHRNPANCQHLPPGW